jgi:hypothetical protein
MQIARRRWSVAYKPSMACSANQRIAAPRGAACIATRVRIAFEYGAKFARYSLI